MGSITVYGASDDLIEVEGDIDEEFSYKNDEYGDVLGFSDGSLIRILYDRDGVWRITPLVKGTNVIEVTQALSGDEDNYSDRATLDGAIKWVLHGGDYAERETS